MPKVWLRPRPSTPKARLRHTCAPALLTPRPHTSSWTLDHGGAPMRWLTRWHHTPTPPLTTEALVAQALTPLAPQLAALTALLPQAVVAQTLLPDPAPPGGLLLGPARLCGRITTVGPLACSRIAWKWPSTPCTPSASQACGGPRSRTRRSGTAARGAGGWARRWPGCSTMAARCSTSP